MIFKELYRISEEKYCKLWEESWWGISRRNIIFQLIKKEKINRNAKVLDVGCSQGLLIKFLNDKGYSNITGIDISREAILLCKKKGIKNAKVMDATKTLFKKNQFDLIIASAILEHIKNDDVALLEWYRLLKPNGKLIIFVPVFRFLWSIHDEINRHFRRYNKLSLIRKLKKAQFKIERVSYWNFFLFFPVFLLRIFQRYSFRRKSELIDFWIVSNFLVNFLLIKLLEVENLLLKFLNLPIGVNLFAVCKK